MNFTWWTQALILELSSEVYWLTFFERCEPMCSLLTPQVPNIFYFTVNQSLFHYHWEESFRNYPDLESPFPVEPILEGTVWGGDRAVLALCFARLLTRLTRTAVAVLCDTQCLSFLQISKMILTKKLRRHFAKLTGVHGQPGVIKRPDMFCICIGCFLYQSGLGGAIGQLDNSLAG